MTMLKILCTLTVLLVTLAMFCSETVESRVYDQNLGGVIRGSPLHYLRFGQGQVNGESSNDDDEERALILPQKRKSEFLSSLYNLPYALVGKRNKN